MSRKVDAVTFIETCLVDPESGKPFVLNRAERRFLKRAFALDRDGRFKHPELLYSCPRKSGKTGFAAMIILYVVRVLGGPYAEGICVANDFSQAQDRVFQAIARIVKATPMLAADATVLADKITFASTGGTIIAIASDYVGAAGANPNIVCFDELWGFTTERAFRLWDELAPPPTRKNACRLTVTYAGYTDESVLLEGLYKRGLQGRKVDADLYEADGVLMFWSHDFVAPWQTEAWRAQMRATMRPTAYLRQIENRWVSTESSFVDMQWWDECTDASARPVFADKALSISIGVDASLKRDSTALVACASVDRNASKVRLVTHRIFQPSPDDPLDFECTIEATILEWMQRFRVREVKFDPYQMQAVAQRLAMKHRVPMVEFAQSVPNLTEASTGLYELIKSRHLVVYPDADIRLAVSRAVAVETSRGWKISKQTASHKIDVVVALGMAALGAVQGGVSRPPLNFSSEVMRRAAMPMPRRRVDWSTRGLITFGG